ncbi:DNA-binding SARP family transcriptional activator [Stackebrandtia endophytica]|uniref:DNA-binding SARP family transcriptional activator n=1 Tax=Stackebrandtia endophytica TaxID=1496996 RepID=A0A543B0W8_9ACTN|nr:BTAD domain-containing putative transcriptional regulator [Stackebrandtia endophytica]TQL78485.1 DNA-binding SARP family transcriptional activator [Stackebrandtia endophytica]
MLIRVIGQVVAIMDGEARPVTAPKMACVLATLTVNPGQPVKMSTLIENVWGIDPPASAVDVLYSYIARLRAVFRNADGLHITRAGSRGYVLETDPSNIDVHQIRLLSDRATAQARAGELPTALKLWREANELARGEALMGVGGDWAEEYRAEFRKERQRLMVDRFKAELQLGHHAAVLGELTEVVAREPIAEPLVEQLMLAQYRCGSADDALGVFETTRTALRSRLGADPSPRLHDLHHRILKGDPTLTTPASSEKIPAPITSPGTMPIQLPSPTDGFIGRDDAITSIVAQSSRHRIIVIDGMAGVGKTTLAVHVAHLLAAEYPDGQLFIDLWGYANGAKPISPDQAVSQLLRSLGVEVPDDVMERETTLRTALAGRRMILILDNVHESSQVLPLLPGSATCLTIITSRRRLVGLVDARPVSLDVLSTGHACELFIAETGLDHVDTEVERIVQACGRLPLALLVVAARLRHHPTWTPTDLLARLVRAPKPLDELDGSAHNVVAAFDLSYQDLEPNARRMFRLLSLSPGQDFDTGTAAALADVEPTEADRVLEALVDSHLVIPQRAGRYRLHDLLRHYGSAQLSDEKQGAWRRLVDDYIERAGHAAHLIHPNFGTPDRDPPTYSVPTDRIEAKNWFDAELRAITAIIDTESDLKHYRQVIELCNSAQLYFVHSDMSPLRQQLAQQGADAAENLGDTMNQARMENYLGLSKWESGNFDAAHSHFARALELSRQCGAKMLTTLIDNNIALVYLDQGDARHATEQFLLAAESAAVHGPPMAEAMSRCNAAKALLLLSRIAEAEAQLDRAENIAQEIGDQVEQARIDFNRATSHRLVGDLDTAWAAFGQVADFCRRHNELEGLISALAGLTEVALDQADHLRALTLAHEQLELLTESAPRHVEPETLTQLGRAQSGLGQFEDALESLHAAISSAGQIGADRLKASAEHALGEHLLQRDDHREEALTLLEAATTFYAASGYPQAMQLRSRLAELVGQSEH